MAERGSGRRAFGPLVLAGLATAGAAALAGSRPAVVADGPGASRLTVAEGVSSPAALAAETPAVASLALVLLAGWGVVLVTRGRVRRVLLAALVVVDLGVLATQVAALRSAPDDVRGALRDAGVEPDGVGLSVWFWIGVVAAVLALPVLVASLRTVRAWPEMGARYDAPGAEQAAGGADAAPAALDDASGLDLWRQLDHGTDPTDTPGPAAPERDRLT